MGHLHCARDGARRFAHILRTGRCCQPSAARGSFLFALFSRSFRAPRILYIDLGEVFGRTVIHVFDVVAFGVICAARGEKKSRGRRNNDVDTVYYLSLSDFPII